MIPLSLRSRAVSYMILPLLAASVTGCATAQQKAENEEMRNLLKSMSTRMEGLESKLATLDEKLDDTQSKVAKLNTPPHPVPHPPAPLKEAGISTHPADAKGSAPEAKVAENDPDAGFTNDESVRQYRKAVILFLSEKYQDATVAFSNFVEEHPDHPLAGSAQYYVGSSYSKQGEYKLAAQEYQRVLTSYDRSSHVAETLRDLAEVEDKLNRREDAGRHRQLLQSLFPNSPAATGGGVVKTSEKAAAPAPAPAAVQPAVAVDEVPGTDPVPNTVRAPVAPKAPLAPAHPSDPGKLDEPPHPLTAPMDTGAKSLE